jgi:hypothetical protein
MKVGISGTREGCNVAQRYELLQLLEDMKELYDTLIHGDCVGVDAEAHDLAYRLGYFTEIFPPIDPKHRAFKSGDFKHQPFPYLQRNHMIVDEADVMLIVPEKSMQDAPRSGTWATYRYALSVGKPTTLIVGGRFEHIPEPDADAVQMPAPEVEPRGELPAPGE